MLSWSNGLAAALVALFSLSTSSFAQVTCFDTADAIDTVSKIRRSVADALAPLPGVPPEESKYLSGERDDIRAVSERPVGDEQQLRERRRALESRPLYRAWVIRTLWSSADGGLSDSIKVMSSLPPGGDLKSAGRRARMLEPMTSALLALKDLDEETMALIKSGAWATTAMTMSQAAVLSAETSMGVQNLALWIGRQGRCLSNLAAR